MGLDKDADRAVSEERDRCVACEEAASFISDIFRFVNEATSWNMSGVWALSRDSRQAREVEITSEEGGKVAVDMPWGRWRVVFSFTCHDDTDMESVARWIKQILKRWLPS